MDRVEAALVRGLSLQRTGGRELRSGRGTAVARQYRGPQIRYCRFVELDLGRLRAFNALALPANDLPIFGLDLVDPGNGSVLVVADASPLTANTPRPKFARPELPRAGELPAWAARWFSPQAIFARVPEVELVYPSLLELVSAYCDLREIAADTRALQRAYCEGHLREDKGLSLLAHVFGEEGRRLLSEVMFPVD